MELFSPHLVQKLWPKIGSVCLGGIWEAVFLSAGQRLGSIRVLTHIAGLNLDFNSPQVRYMLIISCGTLVIQAVKHSWQGYAGLILNQLTPKLPQRDFNFRVHDPNFDRWCYWCSRWKKDISWQKNLGLAFGRLFPGLRMTPKRAIGYLFKYMVQLLPGSRFWLCAAQKPRADEKVRHLP